MDDATFEIMIYVLVFAAAGVIFFGTKWLAAKFGPANGGVAREAFEALEGFEPGEVYAYLGSAIAYDPVGNTIAIWEKSGGARIVDPGGVSEWHSGMLLTQVATRTTATPMIQLYSTAERKPFFKVGVLKETDCAAWRDRLQAAFGGEKEREVDARVAGV
jgi:hypothetical protein